MSYLCISQLLFLDLGHVLRPAAILPRVLSIKKIIDHFIFIPLLKKRTFSFSLFLHYLTFNLHKNWILDKNGFQNCKVGKGFRLN
jgi:hypothetical protein